jgi:hypothetical protein
MATTTNKIAYAVSAPITITADSLAPGSARQAAAVDNTVNLYLDAQVTVVCVLSAGTPGSDKSINIYVAGSEDGTKWPGEGSGNNDGVTGADAAITLESPTNLRLLGSISAPTANKTYTSQPMSVAAAFANLMPRKWAIVIEDRTGMAFGTGCSASYTGVYSTNG